jgi:LPXTG-motif cell wall-anchored protein
LLSSAAGSTAAPVGGGAPGAPDAQGVAYRFVPPGASHPSLVAGVLSAPSLLAPADVARAFVATRPAILGGVEPSALRVAHTRAIRGGAGALVKLVQTVQGLDVVGGGVMVRTDGEGRVRWAQSDAVTLPAGFSVTPTVGAQAAIGIVKAGPAALSTTLAGMSVMNHTRLVVYAPAGLTPKLAWQVHVPGDLVRMEALRVTIDAQTGQVLRIENRAMRGTPAIKAKVYANNPTKTPTLEDVAFDAWLDVETTTLSGPDVVVRNCVDKRTCMPVDFGGQQLSLHFCEGVQTATLGNDGTFLHIDRPALDTEPEDQFAETQMFFHVNKVYGLFRTFGLTDLNERPLSAMVNMRIPFDPSDFGSIFGALCQNGVPPAASTLKGFDNAAFMPKNSLGNFPAEDSIVFGQGTVADFSYDGDVIYHEFAHAVMGTVCPELPAGSLDNRGSDPTPGGLHEGTADYFSAVMTGDPDLAEYAGKALGGSGTALRSLTNTKTCPASLWGETHQDGEQWGGALWDIRTALAEADRAKFDKAVFVAVSAFGANTDQLSAAAGVVAETMTGISQAAATVATQKFAARGLDDCDERVIDLEAIGGTKDVVFMPGAMDYGVNEVGGPTQYKLVLSAAADIKVDITRWQAGGGGLGGGAAPAVKVLVKKDAPITWSYAGGTATHDATGSAAINLPMNAPGTGLVTGALPAGTYYLQLSNAGGGATLVGVSLAAVAPGAPDAGPPAPDAGAAPDAGGQPADDDGGGCGCRTGGSGAPSGLALGGSLLAGLALLIRRRRRRG